MWSHLNCIVNLNFTLFCHKSSNLGKMHLEFWLIVVKYSPLTSCPQFLVVTLGLQNTQFNQNRKSKPIKDEYVNIEFKSGSEAFTIPNLWPGKKASDKITSKSVSNRGLESFSSSTWIRTLVWDILSGPMRAKICSKIVEPYPRSM